MGIVVDLVLERVSAYLGRTYHHTEWRECAADLRLIVVEDVPLNRDGYLFYGGIILRDGLAEPDKEMTAWEEIGHFLTGVGNREFWRKSLPGLQGELNLARFERRADEVRRHLPNWDD